MSGAAEPFGLSSPRPEASTESSAEPLGAKAGRKLAEALSRTLYARALQGHRAYGDRPQNRGKNQTMIGAMALSGLIAGLTFEGGTDGNVFQVFIEQVLVPNLWPGAWVVMASAVSFCRTDNFTAHKVEGIATALASVGAQLVYLPPYSPDFSPIEPFWSKAKSIIRSIAPRTKEALDDAIAEAFAQVSLKDIKHWFVHCCYCTSLE